MNTIKEYLDKIVKFVKETSISIVNWTFGPANRGDSDTILRNWRTWFGHFTVGVSASALGKLLGVFIGLFHTFIGTIIGLSGMVGVGIFYGWREFGIGGDYYARHKGYDSETDSVLDFWVVLVAIVIIANLHVLAGLIFAAVCAGLIYILSKTTE